MLTSNIIKVWSFGRLQDFCALLDALKAEGKTPEDLRFYVKAKRESLAKKTRILDVALNRACPDCGQPLMLSPVNTGPGDQTGDSSTFVWQCQCGFEGWTDMPLRKIIAGSHGG